MNSKKEKVYNLNPEVFLSKKSLDHLEMKLIKSGLDDVSKDLFKEKYKTFFSLIYDLFGHTTSSLSLESILSDGALIPGVHLFSGESSVDFEVRIREFVSFVNVTNLYTLFFLNIFSTYFVKRSELNEYLLFTADTKYPFSFFDDFKDIEKTKYPEMTRARVKKMLRLSEEPKSLIKDDVDKAYSLWKSVFEKREYIRTVKRESFNLEALKALRKSFELGILPEVEFEGKKSSDLSEIINGLNIYSPHSVKESKYHVLRSIYQKLLYDHRIPKYYLLDQEKYREKICKYTLDLLEDDGPFFSKVIDIKKNPEFRYLFKKAESLFPVILFFDFDEDMKKKLFFSATKHMTFEARSRESVSIEDISLILAPYKNTEQLEEILDGLNIEIIPLEIIEMIRSVYHLYV